jgi:hypothetical protein
MEMKLQSVNNKYILNIVNLLQFCSSNSLERKKKCINRKQILFYMYM